MIFLSKYDSMAAALLAYIAILIRRNGFSTVPCHSLSVMYYVYFKVTAFNSAGNGKKSMQISVTLKEPVPSCESQSETSMITHTHTRKWING